MKKLNSSSPLQFGASARLFKATLAALALLW